jgi:hypothetical protein
VENATPANSDADTKNVGGRYFMEESLPLRPEQHRRALAKRLILLPLFLLQFFFAIFSENRMSSFKTI